MKKASMVLLLFFASISLAFAVASSDAARLEMSSGVYAGTGVEIPDNITLVGNLALLYDYGDVGVYNYINAATLEIADLGKKKGVIRIRADYYGNETGTYSCSVQFTSEGWKQLGGDYRLPISFTEAEVTRLQGIQVSVGDAGNFSLVVPVQAPISGASVASVDCVWAEDPDLPPGEYTADISIDVKSNL